VGALSHIRICDLSGQLAGAGATRYLATVGAQVIRVEDPVKQGTWDIVRGAGPFVDDRRGIEFGSGFNNHNVEKLGITLNLREERGKQLLRDLIAISDVVTENFAAGVMARMGFSYDDMRAIKPDILYVSNCGFGAWGPNSSFKTWGPIVQAVAGLTFSSALAGQPPAGWGYSYMDHMGADIMAVAILAGLVHRNRTGEGQWIDMSCTEAGTTLVGQSIGAGSREWANRLGNVIIAMCAALMAIVAVLLLVVGPWLLPLFVSSGGAAADDVVTLGLVLLWPAAAYQIFDGLYCGSSFCLRGAGDTRVPAATALCLSWFLFVPLAHTLIFAPGDGWVDGLPQYGLGAKGGWLALMIYCTLLGCSMFWRWRHGAWRRVKL